MTDNAAPPSRDDEALERFLAGNADDRMRRYQELLRIPSISALPEHAGDCRATANWIVGELRRLGIDDAEASETGGHPIVTGSYRRDGDRPTALVYCHYDVQPVDPLDLWTSPPFEPAVHDGRVVARGAADDKGQVHIHLAALEALLATRSELPVNLRFVFEGEEESSSIHLDPWLEANRERLQADVAIISDTGFFEGNVPAITISLRGLMYAQIDVVGPPVDLHSGGYGGVVENPAMALARILTAIKGADGRIRIPGFYDAVAALTEQEQAELAALPFDEERHRAEIDVPALVGEAGWTTLERRGIRPTFDVNGIWGGFTGEGSKTIIPAHAHAKVSSRLVANQDPQDIFDKLRDFVAEIAPPGVSVEVRYLGGGLPTMTPKDHPATRAAARAIEATFGRAPIFIREGGSIPIAASFERILGLPVVLFGFAPPNDNAHAPNEWMSLDNVEGGIRAVTRLWDELAETG